MAIGLEAEKVFENYPVNNLEAVIAIFWMVERSLRGLRRPKTTKADSHLVDGLLACLSDDYSRDELAVS